jgi:DNA-binding transcriptional MerR regulator
MGDEHQEKSFYRISEVAGMLNVTQSMLRFWEQEIPKLKPVKNRRGERLYTKDHISLIRQIIYLTRTKGYTLEGVRKHLSKPAVQEEIQASLLERLRILREKLLALKDEIDQN